MPPRPPSRPALACLLLLLLTAPASAQDGDPPPGGPDADAGTGAAGEPIDDDASEAQDAQDDADERVGPVVAGAPSEDDPDVVVTASRHEETLLDTPYAVTVLERDDLRTSPDARSLPHTLTREPSVLLQKTGPAQASPYIRGFTGYQTLWLVDGIRLNNSTWRSGPNQYSSTIDLWSVDRLELVRGPGSVLWGSDAIGGVVNALTTPGNADDGWKGGVTMRYSSAERALQTRVEFEGGEPGDWALKGGVTHGNFGTIHAGGDSGDLRNTSYDEDAFDLRFDKRIHERVTWTLAGQRMRQDDAPRTHKTVESVPFHGTVAGSELQRELDQKRDLLWTRFEIDGEDQSSWWDLARVTFSYQKQQEDQERWRTGGRFDRTGFDVETFGIQLEAEKELGHGLLTYGFEHYHDEVDSYRRDYVDGVFQGPEIQGNVADDATYDLSGLYVQDEIVHGDYETTIGLRFTRAALDADKVDNPNVPGGDPSTPGNVLSIDDDWNDLVASVRTLKHLDDRTIAYAGLSQGFRAPNLSDLTSDLEDSGVEQPTPDLDPEYYVSFEIGAKTEQDDWYGEWAAYYTWIDDMIVRSPTGELIDDTPVLQKDNVGDGYVWGLEARVDKRLAKEWMLYSSAAWLDGRVDQFELPSGDKVRKPLDRQMPLTAVLGVTYEPEDEDWWAQADVLMADKADELSLRDETDDERIPPGGTPGYAVFGIRSGRQLDERTTVGLGLENIFDQDYRIHGSGQNEAGRSLVFTWNVIF